MLLGDGGITSVENHVVWICYCLKNILCSLSFDITTCDSGLNGHYEQGDWIGIVDLITTQVIP